MMQSGVLNAGFEVIGSTVNVVNSTLSTTFMYVQSPRFASVSTPSILTIILISYNFSCNIIGLAFLLCD